MINNKDIPRSPTSPTRRPITRARSTSMRDPSDGTRLVGGTCRLRHLQARRSKADRLMPVEERPAPALVRGRALAYASALIDGFSDYILITIDMADPTKPRLAGKYWLPGMNVAAGDAELADAERPLRAASRHHSRGHRVLQLARRLPRGRRCQGSRAKLIVHKVGAAVRRRNAQRAAIAEARSLIVVDETVLDDQEDGFKPIWVFDNQVKSNPISIATFPEPTDKDYLKVGGHFGPHNIHENRPGSFQSEELIFATYQNAGIRAYDIRNQLRPQEVAGCSADAAGALGRPATQSAEVLHSADVYVDKNGPATRPTSTPASISSNTKAEAPAGARLSATRSGKPGRDSRWRRPTFQRRACPQHAPDRPYRSERPRRWSADHVQNGHAYIGHVCSRGFSVVDVRDPTRPKTVNYIENPPTPGAWHLQVHDDLLLLVHGRDMFSQPEMADERNYYKPKAGRHDDHATPQTRNWSAGMAVRHLRAGRATSDRLHAGRGHRAAPHLVRRRPLGLCLGHDGGLLDYILVTIDMADPTARDRRPILAAAGRTSPPARWHWPLPPAATACTTRWSRTTWPIAPGGMPVSGGRRQGQSDPALVVTRTGRRRSAAARTTACRCPSATSHRARRGGARREAGRLQADLGVRQPGEIEPGQRGDFPRAVRRDYIAVGGHLARTTPRNRPGSFAGPELIRDLSERRRQGLRHPRPLRPMEVGACVPPAPKSSSTRARTDRWCCTRRTCSSTRTGFCYCTDWSGAGSTSWNIRGEGIKRRRGAASAAEPDVYLPQIFLYASL